MHRDVGPAVPAVLLEDGRHSRPYVLRILGSERHRMVRRIALGVCVVAVIALVVMLAIPNNRIKLMGSLRGEPFCNDMPLSHWLGVIESPIPNLRYDAILAVRHQKAAIPSLIRRLQDDIPLLRQVAAAEVGRFGPEAKDAVPALTAMLKDEDRACRQAARDALQQIDPKALEPTKSPEPAKAP